VSCVETRASRKWNGRTWPRAICARKQENGSGRRLGGRKQSREETAWKPTGAGRLDWHPGRATYEWQREAENRTPGVQAKKKFAANRSDRDRRSMGRVNGNTIGTGAPWEESTVRRRLSKKESALSTRRSKRRANNDQKLKYEGKYSTLPDPVERTKSGVVQHALVEPGEQIDQKKQGTSYNLQHRDKIKKLIWTSRTRMGK
jgi:hypothetical protein